MKDVPDHFYRKPCWRELKKASKNGRLENLECQKTGRIEKRKFFGNEKQGRECGANTSLFGLRKLGVFLPGSECLWSRRQGWLLVAGGRWQSHVWRVEKAQGSACRELGSEWTRELRWMIGSIEVLFEAADDEATSVSVYLIVWLSVATFDCSYLGMGKGSVWALLGWGFCFLCMIKGWKKV